MSGTYWVPDKEQDFVDLYPKWKVGLDDPASV
jgi:hypothetical protein